MSVSACSRYTRDTLISFHSYREVNGLVDNENLLFTPRFDRLQVYQAEDLL